MRMSLRSPLYVMEPLWQLVSSRRHRFALIQAGIVSLLRDTLVPAWRQLAYTNQFQVGRVCESLMIFGVVCE